MNSMKRAALGVLVLAAAQLAGCAASYQARDVEIKEAMLVNPAILKKGEDGQALYRYVNPVANFKMYDKVLIEPVMVRKDGELDKEARDNFQTLANNAFVYMNQELGKSMTIVKAAEPGTIRLQMAIIDADSAKPVRNTLSTFVPVGMVLSWVKYGATGKQSGVGEISAELKATDAVTGQLLAAAIDRRVGGKDVSKLWSDWYNADEALKYWAKQFSYNLCTIRGGTNCVKPE